MITLLYTRPESWSLFLFVENVLFAQFNKTMLINVVLIFFFRRHSLMWLGQCILL